MTGVYLASHESTCLQGQRTKLTNTEADISFMVDDFVKDGRHNKTFYFTVEVKSAVKPSRLRGTATQGVQLSPVPILEIFIDCISNCGQLMNPSYRLVLSAQCKVCHNMSYTWRLEPSKNSVSKLLPFNTLNGLRQPVININPHVFESGKSETYTITLTGACSQLVVN